MTTTLATRNITAESINDLFTHYEGRPATEYLLNETLAIFTNEFMTDSEKFNTFATKMYHCRGLRGGLTIQVSRAIAREAGIVLSSEDYAREW